MALASEAPTGLQLVDFYDLPDSSTLDVYWRAVAAALVHKRTQYRIKRVFDIALSAMALIFLSPLMLAIAGLVKLTSPGPVLFRQQRLMKDGAEFTLLKFRTMVDGADAMLDKVFHLNEANGPLFKSRRDPRVTRVGRLLRPTFMDELPQLINVLRGEMSLVGPRPVLAREVSDLPGRVVFRFAVPQGLTGPWQTHGHHRLTFEEQMTIERSYIETWSLLEDLVILCQTIRLVLFRLGA